MIAHRIKNDYRALLKAGYAAVKHERKNKIQIRQRIRNRFEDSSSSLAVNDQKIQNTIEFLKTAAKRRGLEHDIVRNICNLDRYRAEYDIRPPMYSKKFSKEVRQLHQSSYEELDLLIKMLNDDLQICL
ncbi:hypothetical protein BDB00DRAFT_546572 [Zychaea mexicana]|uniref:uncharacterized protein n=1 Tax=Zychaea mexicana TaxID=64656 RepID=UPI0022FDE319|nr:uncharacterized protein BDB00DRAFT_546572 [Zychaea mexicana]KAI9497924.1 hypothetical protein BDB00DRAFT_546572 [Zychaea mexicana]